MEVYHLLLKPYQWRVFVDQLVKIVVFLIQLSVLNALVLNNLELNFITMKIRTNVIKPAQQRLMLTHN